MKLFRSCGDGVHKFEARYSLGEQALEGFKSRCTFDDIIQVIEASKSKTYIHDICIKCGKIVRQS